jgi:hypothetical protein
MPKKIITVTHDPKTDAINSYLLKVPYLGKYLSRIYLWRFCTFNFMIVGASGMLLSYLLYEGIFRIFMSPYPGGLFLGMMVTTILVFFWNFFWNKKWSLGINSQILTMKKDELELLNAKVERLLKQKFDHKGERIN